MAAPAVLSTVGPWVRWPLGRWGSLTLGAALALWLGVRWTVLPATVEPDRVEPADAVVVFAGSFERLPVALELMAAGRAPVLVLPNGNRDGWPEANRLCQGRSAGAIATVGDHRFEVTCPVPDPVTTRGEARAIAALAAERGWDSLIAVTSTYHIARAEMLLERCFPGRIQPVAAGTGGLEGARWWRAARHELAGHLGYRVILRGC